MFQFQCSEGRGLCRAARPARRAPTERAVTPSHRLRDARRDHLADVLALAKLLDTVNLPHDEAAIASLLDVSARSFEGTLEPRARVYVFVVEERETGRIVGTSMIHAQHGTRRAPHVFFDVLEEERYSETLDRHARHAVLRIGYDYDGPTEIGGLVLHPLLRGGPARLGLLASLARFVFIATHRACFRDQILAELLPPLEPDGTSLLWEHLGSRFTGLTYAKADRLSQTNKEFIRTLFPHDPICASLLPEAVRALIGKVGDATRPVERMLRAIGFEYASRIDPFDGGPHFVAVTDDIAVVKTVRRAAVAREDLPRDEAESATLGIVAREPDDAETDAHGLKFVACISRYARRGGSVLLPAATRALLDASPSDMVSLSPLPPLSPRGT